MPVRFSEADRKRALTTGVFTKSPELEHMKEILLVEATSCLEKAPTWQTLTLGQLEDLVQAALQRLTEQGGPRTSHEGEDARQLRKHALRPSRVDIENVKNSRRQADKYSEAAEALAAWRADPASVYFWEKERKCGLLSEQLEVVKNRWLKVQTREVESSDSEEEVR